MPKMTIAIHSYRGGTGKSTTTANLATALAILGHKVATIDLDLTSPGLHVIFNVGQSALKHTLNDYLYRRCSLEECIVDVTEKLGIPNGRLYFIGSSMKPEEIAQLMKEEYNEMLFKHIAATLQEEFDIDFVIFDTHPGLVEDTLLAVLSSDFSIVTMRMDRQDISGTYLLVQVLRQFGKVCYILINMIPPELAQVTDLSEEISKTLGVPVLGVIPFYDEVLAYRSKGVFLLQHPQHNYSLQIMRLAKTLSSWR